MVKRKKKTLLHIINNLKTINKMKTKINLLKLIGIKYQVWEDGNPTNKISQIEAFINPSFIISIENLKVEKKDNYYVNIPEQIGSDITVSKGLTCCSYTDTRTPGDLNKILLTYNN